MSLRTYICCDECGSEPVAFSPCIDCQNSKELVTLRAERDALKATVKEERELALTAEDALKASETERHRLTARVAELEAKLEARFVSLDTAVDALKVEREAHAANWERYSDAEARERGLRAALGRIESGCVTDMLDVEVRDLARAALAEKPEANLSREMCLLACTGCDAPPHDGPCKESP